MARGRPVGSDIRQNMVEILYFLGEGTGYDIYKVYRDLFPDISMRSIYYHLKKGVSLKEFSVKKIKKEDGDYSWGGQAEKIYYSLGQEAKPKGLDRVRDHIETVKNDSS